MTRSDDLFERARRVIPGGVNSPVRAFVAVGGTPRFAVRGEGAYVIDAGGNRYVDLVQSWGALLFGHARKEIVEASVAAAERGTSFGAPTEGEIELAERIVAAVPSVEEVRLVSSGTEAAMSAVRLVRGFTGRDVVLKFEGCYHGHSDALLARGATGKDALIKLEGCYHGHSDALLAHGGGSGLATFGIPGSPGVTEGAARDTLTVPFNDLEAARSVFDEGAERIAAVIVEPVAANMGVVPPEPGFLEGLRTLCTASGALLVFDEVITGFRIAFGGAQAVYGVTPDLTVLGKVMGGGFPCAAFGGRHDVMERLAPLGPVYQAGTLSGNPVVVAAGVAALDLAAELDPYEELTARATTLAAGLGRALGGAGPVTVNRAGSLLSPFFAEGPVRNFAEARGADHERYALFFHHMLERGVWVPPSGYELWTLGTEHGDRELETVVQAAASFELPA